MPGTGVDNVRPLPFAYTPVTLLSPIQLVPILGQLHKDTSRLDVSRPESRLGH
jgi:hypothetical protein